MSKVATIMNSPVVTDMVLYMSVLIGFAAVFFLNKVLREKF
jgi:hypothetical protein